MRTVTETYNVYTYTELSEKAKEKVKQWYLDDDFRVIEFDEIYKRDLHYLFPNSELNLQFSLNGCQGDGLNIYGKLDLLDVFRAINDKTYCGDTFKDFWDCITKHEQKTMEAYMKKVCGSIVDLPCNRYYAYCVAYRVDFADNWFAELEYQGYKNIRIDTIRKVEKIVANMFTKLSKKYEEYGYQYLYEADEEEITETCAANGWEFLEDGTFYVV